MIQKNRAYASVGKLHLSEGDWEDRSDFYLYCRQQGLWPQEVGGQDPQINPDWFARFCPVQNVTGNYPPTLLIHGDEDTDVPYEKSLEMDAALEHCHVKHQLITLKGRGHVFDAALDAPKDPVLSRLLDQVVEFLKQHNDNGL